MLKDVIVNLETHPKVFILRMRRVPMIDASGMNGLKEFYHKCHRANTILILSGVHGQTEQDLKNFGMTKLIGEEHIFSNIDAALAKASSLTEK